MNFHKQLACLEISWSKYLPSLKLYSSRSYVKKETKQWRKLQKELSPKQYFKKIFDSKDQLDFVVFYCGQLKFFDFAFHEGDIIFDLPFWSDNLNKEIEPAIVKGFRKLGFKEDKTDGDWKSHHYSFIDHDYGSSIMANLEDNKDLATALAETLLKQTNTDPKKVKIKFF